MQILWVSRHSMTEEQINDLNRIYGDNEIIQMDETVKNVEQILSYNSDVYAVVLPIDFIADLCSNTSKDVIRPISKRVKTNGEIINPATGKMETEYIYKHEGWQKIKQIKIETEML